MGCARHSKIKPLDLAHNAIDQAFRILLEHSPCQYADEFSEAMDDPDLTKCFEILRDARIRLDNLSIKERKTMLAAKDAKTQKIERELAECERSYRILVKLNPQSINDTHRHLSEIDTVVRDMTPLRTPPHTPTATSSLTPLIY